MKNLSFLLLFFIGFYAGTHAQDHGKQISLDDIFRSADFYPSYVRGLKSLNDGEHYAVIEKDTLFKYSYKSGERVEVITVLTDIVAEGGGEPLRFRSYSFSPDEKYILFPTETESIYRHSSRSNFYIWDIEAKKLTALSKNGKQRLARFSPLNDKIAFVRDNNLFVYDLKSGAEEQITTDGKDRHIINGTTDWVYEEEFGFTRAFFWSPDGHRIAYYRFDESNVKEFQFAMYGELYPEQYKYKYPKAGEDNSLVEVFIYELESGTKTPVDLGSETDQYVPRIKWTSDPEKLAVYRLNRHQNHLEILQASANDGKTSLLYEEKNKYYIDINDDLYFTKNGKYFLFTSEKDGYNQVFMHSMDGKEQKCLTGSYDVTQLYGVDEKHKIVYYQAAKTAPENRDLMLVDFKGREKILSENEGSNSASFNEAYTYYISTWSSAAHPPVFKLFNAKGKLIRTLKDNQELTERLAEYDLSAQEFMSIPAGDSLQLNAWMIKPPKFDPKKKYPVLMYVYGGPGSQTVLNRWSSRNMWYQMLAQKGIIVVSVDNRGTGARGEEFKKMTYLQLGKYETEDQIAAAKYLAKQEYVDGNHIGIFGWSYGGYMSTLCMTKGADVFSTGIAVAPVTNWRYYDNIYTERYMRTPQENAEGYDQNSPINHVDKLKGDYLLVHGTADDNVHYQNALELVTALVDADKQFEMQFYPNSNHGIYTGRNTSYHLYKRMTGFLMKNLKGEK